LIGEDGDTLTLSQDMKVGLYRFEYNLDYMSKNIQIRVHSGFRWEYEENYLIKENEILKLQDQNKYLVCNNFKVDEDNVNFNVETYNIDKARVHVLGFNYMPEFNDLKFKEFCMKNQDAKEFLQSETYKVKKNSNTY